MCKIIQLTGISTLIIVIIILAVFSRILRWKESPDNSSQLKLEYPSTGTHFELIIQYGYTIRREYVNRKAGTKP
jgi:hypothetical protein